MGREEWARKLTTAGKEKLRMHFSVQSCGHVVLRNSWYLCGPAVHEVIAARSYHLYHHTGFCFTSLLLQAVVQRQYKPTTYAIQATVGYISVVWQLVKEEAIVPGSNHRPRTYIHHSHRMLFVLVNAIVSQF